MAYRTLEKGGQELTGMYPKFDEIGDYVTGNFTGLVEDDYGHLRIELYKGFDEETGEDKLQILPAHKDLTRYYDQLEKGDWLRIELIKIIKSNNENYADKKIYKVQVDDERAVEFGDDEE